MAKKNNLNISQMVGTRYFAYHRYKDDIYGDDFLTQQNRLIDNLNNIHSKMLERLKTKSNKQEAKNLQKILNDYYHLLAGDKDDYNKIMTKLAKRTLGSLKDLKIEENININLAKASSLKANFEKEYDKYKKQLGKDVKSEIIQSQPKVSEAFKRWMSAYAKMNTDRGQLFEAFIQMVVPYTHAYVSQTGQEKIEEILNQISQDILSSNKTIKTAGSDLRTVEISLGKGNWEYKTQGKTDISIPVKDENNAENFKYNISAKNYSKSRDISLVDNASILGLVSSWPQEYEHTKNFYLSALSYYTQQPRNSFLDMAEKIFIIQALVGTTWGEEWSDYLIVNNRSSNQDPIRVLSTYEILTGRNYNDMVHPDDFELKYSPYKNRNLFNPKQKEGKNPKDRTPKEIDKRVSSMKLSIKMKAALFNKVYKKMLTN